MYWNVHIWYVLVNVSEFKEYNFFGDVLCDFIWAWLGNQQQSHYYSSRGNDGLSEFGENPESSFPKKEQRNMDEERKEGSDILYSIF